MNESRIASGSPGGDEPAGGSGDTSGDAREEIAATASRGGSEEADGRKVAFRILSGGPERLVFWLAIAIGLLHLYMNGLGSLLVQATSWGLGAGGIELVRRTGSPRRCASWRRRRRW